MSSTFYVQTTQTGTAVQVKLFVVGGEGVETSDFNLVFAPTSTAFVSFVGPSGWSGFPNATTPGAVLVSQLDFSLASPVGLGADGLLGTINLTLPTAGDTLAGTLTITDYSNPSSVDFGTAIPLTLPTAPCFVRGTRLRTPRGEVAVEALAAGDRVSLAGGGTAEVVWVGHRDVNVAQHPRPQDVKPVRVRAGAAGAGIPARDVLLSPDHALYLDGVLIPVRYLKNGATIVDAEMAEVSYFHVELARHDVLLAEGLPVESFLDTGNRGAFANADEPVMIHPDFAMRRWEQAACAKLVLEGAELEAVRSFLGVRAAALGWGITREPEMAVRVGDVPVAVHRSGTQYLAGLNGRAGAVRIGSRSAVPSDLDLPADRRRLGVAIGMILVDGVPVALDDARLAAGWYTIEHDDAGREWRWTDGDAVLLLDGARTLEFEVMMAGTYRSEPARSQAAA